MMHFWCSDGHCSLMVQGIAFWWVFLHFALWLFGFYGHLFFGYFPDG